MITKNLNPSIWQYLVNQVSRNNFYKFNLCCSKWILFWIFFTTLIKAQNEISFQRYSTEQGLSQNSIVRVYQDSKGFLWIGTFDGLNKFDGYDFKTYNNIPGDSSSLSNNKILSIYEDDEGFIWIGTYGGGLNKFDRKKESFKRYTYIDDATNCISSNIVTSIVQDETGLIWIGTIGGGLNKFDPTNEIFFHYKYDSKNHKSISNNNVICLNAEDDGSIWIGTLDGLNKFDKTNDSFKVYKFDPEDPFSISSSKISSIIKDKSTGYWVGTFDAGLNTFNLTSPYFSPNLFADKIKFNHITQKSHDSNSLSSNGILSICQDNWGDIWIGTDGGGLNKIKINHEPLSSNNSESEYYKSLIFEHFKHNPNNNLSLSDDRVWSILEDRSGILWIGTNSGLNKVDIQKQQFTSFCYDPLHSGSLSDGDVSSILEDDSGNLWVGTGGGGLNLYDPKHKVFIKFKNDPDDPYSLSNNEVLALYQDRNGNIWIGTYDGLNKLSSESLIKVKTQQRSPKFTHYKHDSNNPGSLSDNRVYSILEDKSGNLWIGTVDGGLNRLSPGSNEINNKVPLIFQHYKNNPNDPNSLSSNRVFSIYEDSQGNLWIGTWGGGLNKLIKSGNEINSRATFKQYKHDPKNPFSLSDNGVLSIYEDKNKCLWVGTYGGGLNKYIPEDESFITYTEKDGLSNNVVLGICEDTKGNLWISTVKKLNKFNPSNISFSHFQISDGLPGNEFSLGVTKSSSGEILFGTTEGLVKFHPDSIKVFSNENPVLITELKLFNRSIPIGYDSLSKRVILENSILDTKQIDLEYDDNVLSFEFAAIDFHQPEKVNYLYKLEGFDEDWNKTDASKRFANYTNLDPGQYKFIVKTENSSVGSLAELNINIFPPWWRTIWAYSLYVLLFAMTLILLYKLKVRRIKLRHEVEMSRFEAKKLQEINELKSNFFENISHEFRTPLTLILGPLKDLIGSEENFTKKKDLEIVYKNADVLHHLVNQLMDLSKIEAGKMTLSVTKVDLTLTVKGIVESFSSFSEIKNISLRFQSNVDAIISYFDIDKIEKIFINLISNSLKFTPEGKEVNIKLTLHNEFVEAIISDQGIGIPEDRIKNIFDRFYQVDNDQTKQRQGTGIGLALTKELVEIHKGNIDVKSKEGIGTTFTIKLPFGKKFFSEEQFQNENVERIDKGKLNVPPPDSEIEPKKSDSIDISFFSENEKPLVLIIEDNEDVRNYIKGHLANDYRILLAVDGEEGLDKSLEYIPELIISDVKMPKLNGFELCKKIKKDERTSHIPIILLTAKAAGEDKLEGLKTGADDYISKPFQALELKVRIKNLITQRKKIAEHYRNKQLFDVTEINSTSTDKKFLTKAFDVINKNISDENFNVEAFANEMALSRVQLHRKLVALVGHSPGEFIRAVRLTKASELIKNNYGNISEIALELGFSNPANFAKAFRSQFGVSPSEFKSNHLKN